MSSGMLLRMRCFQSPISSCAWTWLSTSRRWWSWTSTRPRAPGCRCNVRPCGHRFSPDLPLAALDSLDEHDNNQGRGIQSASCRAALPLSRTSRVPKILPGTFCSACALDLLCMLQRTLPSAFAACAWRSAALFNFQLPCIIAVLARLELLRLCWLKLSLALALAQLASFSSSLSFHLQICYCSFFALAESISSFASSFT